MIYCIDVDGTICTITENQEYHKAIPVPEIINKINKLYDEGHTIKIATARGQTSGKDFSELTSNQLEEWGVKYHEMWAKPSADFYVDDKSLDPGSFLLGIDYDITSSGVKRGFSEAGVNFFSREKLCQKES